jgi:hypothetical protein
MKNYEIRFARPDIVFEIEAVDRMQAQEQGFQKLFDTHTAEEAWGCYIADIEEIEEN